MILISKGKIELKLNSTKRCTESNKIITTK